jgi:GDPmannose 4,6-dehydratase
MSSGRRAIVTGASGQDGSYLVEHLLNQGYEVLGLVHRPTRSPAPAAGVTLLPFSLDICGELDEALREFRPHEFYNLAARSSGAGMFDDPVAIGELNGLAVTRMLEAIRRTGREVRFCQASSSELFGDAAESPQNESTPFRPRSPYGVAKLYAHWTVDGFRKRHGLFACSALLFNHESPRRGLSFVTRKVTHAAARIKLGMSTKVELGNLDARRDWGFAGDYMRAMWLMLQQPVPDDYVVATGVTHSVRELCEIAFEHVGLDYRAHAVEVSGDYRAPEAVQLVGNASRASEKLGWAPSMDFRQLITSMVDHDLALLQSPP